MPIIERDPSSDISATGTWSGTAGSRYTLVYDFDDQAVDFLTHGTTAGSIMFGFPAFDVPAGSTDIVLRIKYYANRTGSGGANMASRIRVGVSVYNPTVYTIAQAVTLYTDTWTTNPRDGVAWTVNEINRNDGGSIRELTGFGLTSTDANPTIRIYSMQAEVEYTSPAGGTARSYGFIIG